ncbi:hypothetical protein GIV70_01645 [Pseudomonas syringae]|uniref:hypothetical protein n=1 Tax=Pseudomonas syringae TaxID=317 RepID=UPI001F3B1FC5|nr:hypothetical protein [Pseudomonas syringae]MCF5533500.1 hypothetical protein [Pseudomonas syringae]MCF5574408.1 hypothetical protein [Pseudomonas syringae]MCF5626268.1 hypothetical protein [Pseudomonas syringae]MCF5678914.1 hypothetical protein [Pseudomonas syringae]
MQAITILRIKDSISNDFDAVKHAAETKPAKAAAEAKLAKVAAETKPAKTAAEAKPAKTAMEISYGHVPADSLTVH